MAIPTIEQLMAANISELTDYPLLETGRYLGVVTGCEARPGGKGMYLNLETTLHQTEAGDESCKGRKVWRNVSFSEKALTMPGGLAQLIQSTSPTVPAGTSPEQLPSVLSAVLVGETIGIDLDHEQGWKDGGPAFDESNNPIMREAVAEFFKADDSFAKGIEAAVDGNDAALPF